MWKVSLYIVHKKINKLINKILIKQLTYKINYAIIIIIICTKSTKYTNKIITHNWLTHMLAITIQKILCKIYLFIIQELAQIFCINIF